MGSTTSTAHIDVAYVARLARMHLAPDETARLQAQLDQIVSYVKQIDELDVTDVEPTSHAVAITNVFRADEPRSGLPHDTVMANAPDEISGQFQVPKIIE